MKREWLLLVVVIVAEFFVFFIKKYLYRKYKSTKHSSDDFMNFQNPVKKCDGIMQLCLGALWLIAAGFLYGEYYKVSIMLSLGLFVCIAGYAVCCKIIAGIFLMGEYTKGKSRSAMVHKTCSKLGTVLFILAPLCLTFIGSQQNDLAIIIFSTSFFVESIICLLIFHLSEKGKLKGAIFAEKDIWKDMAIYCVYLLFYSIGMNHLLP